MKTVAQVILNFMMNVFLLPITFCEEIEQMFNSFWWGCEHGVHKGIRWKQWDYLCKPKKYSGLGFRRLRGFNLAMLAK